jgi:acyl carrier protein
MLREQDVRQWLTGYLAELLDRPEAEILPDQEFKHYGLDSLDAMVAGGALEDRFEVDLEASLFLRCKTIDELIADLRRSSLLE